MNKHILFVCNEYPPNEHGGIGIFVKNLAEQLIAKGFRCSVVGVYKQAKDTEEIISGVHIYRYKKEKKSRFPFSILKNIYNEIQERKLLSSKINLLEKKQKIDLIESYEWKGVLYKKPITPLLVRLHGSHKAHAFYTNTQSSRFLNYWESKNLKMADAVVSVSAHILKITQESFGKINVPNEIIYNSVDTKKFKLLYDISRNEHQIIFVGKFHERKGVFELFKILAILLQRNTTLKFLFIGNHKEENKMTLLKKIPNSLHSYIQFINAIPQDNLPKIYNQSALMIMPTRAEAFGLTTIEAMACGCVVAISNVATGPELVKNNIDGIVIDTLNAEDSATAIEHLLNDKNKLESLRRNAIKKVEKELSNEIILEKNIQFYYKLLNC